MNELQKHRGPDGSGIWRHKKEYLGFAHRRLSIIDLAMGHQPMRDKTDNWITYNGEIYNYLELRDELGIENFKTTSDTEVILQGYHKWGTDCIKHLRGMFSFALWDEENHRLFCGRDRFGIKPFYYTVVDGIFYFASEVKALLPFVHHIETDLEGLTDYLIFQFCMAGKTLFKGIYELLPGHILNIDNSSIELKRYWDVYYDLDFDHTAKYFEERLRNLLSESVDLHLRSDVPVGTYLSGGLDSSVVTSLASKKSRDKLLAFNGKFSFNKQFDESQYAREVAKWSGTELHEIDISIDDFVENIRRLVYHLDYPVAGPGSFPQYMVSKYASQFRKVLLGGQGGDEIFGGYTRYLIAYFEQCIKAAIDETMHNGNFIVTYESIIPNLKALRNYKPLLKEFWREGLFEEMDRRYFRLINRSSLIQDEVNWELLRGYSPFETFCKIFNGNNVQKESYFNLMTHFDFKTLLPALLQVEDRVSMAHGVESRVPFLDHPLVELSATIPSNIKFKDGTMKQVLKAAMKPILPETIINRKDKMGFPVPLTQWIKGEAKEFIYDIFSSEAALSRELINNRKVLNGLTREPEYGRKIWGMLCLELWQQEFHDKEFTFKQLLNQKGVT
jgi:asparagine synthase (glutamine-hydrolysing)